MKKVFSFIILVALILSIILFMESCKKEEYVTVEGVYFTDEFPSCPWQNEKDYDAIKIKFVGDMVYICFVYDKYTIYGVDWTIGYQGGYEHEYLIDASNIIIKY